MRSFGREMLHLACTECMYHTAPEGEGPHAETDAAIKRIKKKWNSDRAKGRFPATEAMHRLMKFLNEEY